MSETLEALHRAQELSLLLTASVPLLPLGWQIAHDPATGKFYFYSTITGVVQWEPPGITVNRGVLTQRQWNALSLTLSPLIVALELEAVSRGSVELARSSTMSSCLTWLTSAACAESPSDRSKSPTCLRIALSDRNAISAMFIAMNPRIFYSAKAVDSLIDEYLRFMQLKVMKAKLINALSDQAQTQHDMQILSPSNVIDAIWHGKFRKRTCLCLVFGRE